MPLRLDDGETLVITSKKDLKEILQHLRNQYIWRVNSTVNALQSIRSDLYDRLVEKRLYINARTRESKIRALGECSFYPTELDLYSDEQINTLIKQERYKVDLRIFHLKQRENNFDKGEQEQELALYKAGKDLYEMMFDDNDDKDLDDDIVF
jgi:hypothetical protein